MYRNIFLLGASAFLLSGCTESLNTVNSVINTVGKIGNVTGINTYSMKKSGNYSVKTESITPVIIKKTTRDYGKISVLKYEKNPQNRTMVYINQCMHPQIGNLKCSGYIYPMTPEGWLVKKRISIKSNKRTILASAKYYLKVQNKSSVTYNVTGEVSIKPFVTNYVNLTLE